MADQGNQLNIPAEWAFRHTLYVRYQGLQTFKPGADGSARTLISYCDPMWSAQKDDMENVHTKLKEILPKGPILNT